MLPALAQPLPQRSAEARFAADREAIERHLELLLAAPSATPFRQAMSYAVLGQGQRFRPVLAIRIARLCGHENALTLRAAAAVEILHCASLVVDDLPCMDNSAERRNRPAAHVAFGEATALLAAFGLVALAARSILEQPCPPEALPALVRFQGHLLRTLDVCGLCEGQDLDLRTAPCERARLRDCMNELKTVPLFELAAQAGLLLADPSSPQARALRQFAREFGRAFQLVDDYLDGEISDFAAVDARLRRAEQALAPLRPDATELLEMVEVLRARCR
ncbi:MAG: polyprenyl synthetase family protein [Bryobacteraceae bacterium]|nr:polyprenyl synthetase family protein [Bryobacteraceae bacterium]MCX7602734.1 polyprenyl synthetase family protein [Bryobacteraceae bacterium]